MKFKLKYFTFNRSYPLKFDNENFSDSLRIYVTSYIPVQLALIKKSRSVGQGNRQGTEVGRAREKAGHRNRQGKEVGRARK